MRCRFDHTGRTAGMPGTLTPEFEEFRTLVLDAANEDQLLQYLRECTTPGSYSGSHFHELTYAVPSHPDRFDIADVTAPRSEERRVGKECRPQWESERERIEIHTV